MRPPLKRQSKTEGLSRYDSEAYRREEGNSVGFVLPANVLNRRQAAVAAINDVVNVTALLSSGILGTNGFNTRALDLSTEK